MKGLCVDTLNLDVVHKICKTLQKHYEIQIFSKKDFFTNFAILKLLAKDFLNLQEIKRAETLNVFFRESIGNEELIFEEIKDQNDKNDFTKGGLDLIFSIKNLKKFVSTVDFDLEKLNYMTDFPWTKDLVSLNYLLIFKPILYYIHVFYLRCYNCCWH